MITAAIGFPHYVLTIPLSFSCEKCRTIPLSYVMSFGRFNVDVLTLSIQFSILLTAYIFPMNFEALKRRLKTISKVLI